MKISPVAMISHKRKAYRCILYLSFHPSLKQKMFKWVNIQTNKQAKSEVMVQLGLALQRLIAIMADRHNPELSFILSKLNIKYGFWSMAASDDDAWNFWYVLPSLNPVDYIHYIKIMVPNSFHMGWCEIPPLLCSSIETSRYVIGKLTNIGYLLPTHPFEKSC